MYITDGAKGLLSQEMRNDSQVAGETTSFSDYKGDSCVTRVFRVPEDAQEWLRLVREECNSPSSRIAVREMWIPSNGLDEIEETLVIAINCADLALRDEPEDEVRVAYTPGGMRIMEVMGVPTSVNVEYESKLLGCLSGSVNYDGARWTADLTLESAGFQGTERDLTHGKIFNNIQEALEAIDLLIKKREEREESQRERNQRKAEDARSQINGLFGEEN